MLPFLRGHLTAVTLAFALLAWADVSAGCAVGGGQPRPTADMSHARPPTATARRRVGVRIRLPDPAASLAVGAGYVWALTREPAALWRIDPRTDRVAGRAIRLPAGR